MLNCLFLLVVRNEKWQVLSSKLADLSCFVQPSAESLRTDVPSVAINIYIFVRHCLVYLFIYLSHATFTRQSSFELTLHCGFIFRTCLLKMPSNLHSGPCHADSKPEHCFLCFCQSSGACTLSILVRTIRFVCLRLDLREWWNRACDLY